jgi:hypothetical protein
VPKPARRGPLLIDRLTSLTREGQRDGEITIDRSPEDVAELLLGLIDGFSLHALLDPDRLSRERQMNLSAAHARINTKAGSSPWLSREEQ